MWLSRAEFRRTVWRAADCGQRDLNIIIERLTHMATQEDIDRISGQIDTAVTNIRQDIADIKAANPGVDLTALEASVSGLTDLDAENPAPTV